MDGIDSAVPGPISPASPPPAAAVGEAVGADRVGETGPALGAAVLVRDVTVRDGVLVRDVVAVGVVGTADRLAGVDADPGARASPPLEAGVVAPLVVAPLVASVTEATDGDRDTDVLPFAAVLVGPAAGDEVHDATTASSTSPASLAATDDARII